MIYGIGTDIVKVSRMAENLEKYGSRFSKRILSESEHQLLLDKIKPEIFLAKRFAAKEAAVKALGTGFRYGISMRHIIVESNELGKPNLRFIEAAKKYIEENNITQSHLSISDEQEYAIAYVILESAL